MNWMLGISESVSRPARIQKILSSNKCWEVYIHLEDRCTIGCPPGIEEVVLASGDEPLATGGKAQRQHAALVEMQLVLVGLVRVQDFHITVLHSYSQPLTGRTVTCSRETLLYQNIYYLIGHKKVHGKSHCYSKMTSNKLKTMLDYKTIELFQIKQSWTLKNSPSTK